MKKLFISKKGYESYSDGPKELCKKIMEEDIKPWLTSFNNIFFERIVIHTNEGYIIYDFNIGSNSLFLRVSLSQERYGSGKYGHLTFQIYDKTNDNVIQSYKALVGFIDWSNELQCYSTIFSLYATSKNNDLLALFLSAGFGVDIPQTSGAFIIDTDYFGEKYLCIMTATSASSSIFYLLENNATRYETKSGNSSVYNYKKYSSEDFISVARCKIYLGSLLVSLSTNMLSINNTFLETDKGTFFKTIEVNGVKYRKITYDIWIEDNED